MNERMTKEELEKLLDAKEKEIVRLENTIYQQENICIYREDCARKEGYQTAMKEIIKLLHDIFGKEKE